MRHPAILPSFALAARAVQPGIGRRVPSRPCPTASRPSNADEPDDVEAEPGEEPEAADGPILSTYGIASAVLGVLSVAAVVLGVIIWSAHRDEAGERTYLSRVCRPPPTGRAC